MKDQSNPPANHSPTSTPTSFATSPIQSPDTFTHHLSPASAVVFPLLRLVAPDDPPPTRPLPPLLSLAPAGTTSRNLRNVASSAYIASDTAAVLIGFAGGLGSMAW